VNAKEGVNKSNHPIQNPSPQTQNNYNVLYLNNALLCDKSVLNQRRSPKFKKVKDDVIMCCLVRAIAHHRGQ
jgi:hypothetical protein